MTEISNSGQSRGSFAVVKEPHAAAKVHVAAKGSHTATWPRRKNGPASGSPQCSGATQQQRASPQSSSATLRRSYYSQHEKCCVLFCSAIPLFQGLVYWTNEYLISV